MSQSMPRGLAQPIIGLQMLFVAFGALVLVPILTGLDPNVALFTAGMGTLIFHIITGGQVPIFLASSFAFIAPIIYGVQTWGIPATMSGLMAAGFVYILLSVLVKFKGQAMLQRILPPIVVGPVIMVIGLGLAPVAVNLALGKSGDGGAELVPYSSALFISLTSLIVTVLAATLSQGWIRLLSILCGVFAGYMVSLFFGIVNLEAVSQAPWFAVPNFVAPEFSWQAIFFIVPVAIAPAIEHLGDVLAISRVTGKNYLEKPGLHRTLLGDGIATSAAAMVGGPPNTTYSEVTGAVTLTKMYSPRVMVFAAVFAVIFSFCGKLGAFLSTIPTPVMGGIMTLLFGTIAAVGMNSLIHAKEELTEPRNLVIVALILVFGIGGMQIGSDAFSLKGLGLAGIVGVVLNLVLPRHKSA